MGKILICEPIQAGGGIRVSPRQNFARIFLPSPGRKNSTRLLMLEVRAATKKTILNDKRASKETPHLRQKESD